MKRHLWRKNSILLVLLVLLAAAALLPVGRRMGWFGAGDASVTPERGSACLLRGGLASTLSGSCPLRPGDTVTVSSGSVRLSCGEAQVLLAPGSLRVESLSPCRLTLLSGELFFSGSGQLTVEGSLLSAEAAVASVCSDGTALLLAGSLSRDGSALSPAPDPAQLSDFALSRAREGDIALCFDADRLAREALRRSIGAEPDSGSGDLHCTVEIRCDTILQHMDRLSPGKDIYVPADGVLLPAVELSFQPGETAFDLLRRACQQADIPLEYSWTPLYDSYYVEGIGHLYEFDCGSQSGWMFRVNGAFPNLGSSDFVLSDGDSVSWLYTCTGLGADVEGQVSP